MEYQAWCGKTTSIAPLSPLATEANPEFGEECEGGSLLHPAVLLSSDFVGSSPLRRMKSGDQAKAEKLTFSIVHVISRDVNIY